MDYLIGISRVIFFCFILGLGPSTFLLARNHRFITILYSAPVIGLAICLLSGIYLIRLNLSVSQWYFPYSIGLLLLSMGLFLQEFGHKKILFDVSEVHEIIQSLGLFLITCIVLTYPLWENGETFSTFRGNLYDNTNYVSEAMYLDHRPFNWVDNKPLSEILDQEPVGTLVLHLRRGRIGITTLLAWFSHIAGLPASRFDYAFTLVFYLLAFFPTLMIIKNFTKSPFIKLLIFLCVLTGFWPQIILDTRAFGQIISIPLFLFLIWLFCQRNLNEDTNWDAGLFGGLLAVSVLTYPEITPTFGFGFGICYLLMILRNRMTRKHAQLLLFSTGIFLLVFLPYSQNFFQFITSQFHQTIFQPATMDWHHDWFNFLFYDLSFTGFWGLSFLFTFINENSTTAKNLLSSYTFLLTIFLFMFLYYALRKKDFNMLHVCLASMAIVSLTQMVYLFLRGNYWAAIKGLSYGFPVISLFLIFSITVLSKALNPVWAERKYLNQGIFLKIPRMGGLGRLKNFLIVIILFLPVAWFFLQVVFSIFRLPLLKDGKTFFHPNDPFHRSGLSVDFDRDVIKLKQIQDQLLGTTVLVAVPSVWTWEYLIISLGEGIRWQPVFALNHYQLEGIFHYDQVENYPIPNFILCDKSICNGLPNLDRLPILFESNKSILLKIDPEFQYYDLRYFYQTLYQEGIITNND